MPSFSLFQPLPGLPLYLWPVWPLIYWRILRLKAWFRANGRPGSKMLWGVTRDGRIVVNLLSDDLSGRTPPRSGFDFEPSRHFREAAYGEVRVLIPDATRQQKLGSLGIASERGAQENDFHREYGNSPLLPPPDT